jgi:hypothetical protein
VREFLKKRADDVQELEQQMDALAREYATHDPKLIAELKKLSRRCASLRNSDAVRTRDTLLTGTRY